MQSGDARPAAASYLPPIPLVRAAGGFIWSAVTVRIGFTARRREHIDIRIIRGVVRDTSSDFENTDFGAGAILQAVPVGIAGFETSSITCAQNFFAAVSGERHLARKHKDKLIRFRMPVTLA